MAGRRSTFQQYKEAVFGMYAAGSKPQDAIAVYNIPQSTAYKWHRDFLGKESPSNRSKKRVAVSAGTGLEVEVVEEDFGYKAEFTKESDYDKVRRVMRDICDYPDKHETQFIIQAATALTRLMALRSKSSEDDLRVDVAIAEPVETAQLEGMSTDDLASLIKDMLR